HLSHRIAPALGEGLERPFPYIVMLVPQRPQRAPELLLPERGDAVVRKETPDLAESSQSRYLSKAQGPDLQGRDTPRQAIAPGFGAKRGTSRHEHPHRVDVDEMLELDGPVSQVLYLVEQQERSGPSERRLVEGLAQDLLCEPTAQIQDGLLQ